MAKYFKLIKNEEESIETYELSKILGSPVFPKSFFKENRLDELFFVAQINLTQLDSTRLPKEGFLYFFLNVDCYPYQAKVLYSKEEVIEVYDDINEDFEDFGDYHGCLMEFTDNSDEANSIDSPIDFDISSEFDITGYVSLLTIDSLYLPNNTLFLGQPDGWYMFLIKEEELLNNNFNNVKFICFGS